MGLFKLASDIFTDYEGTITEAVFKFNEYGGQMAFVVDEIDGREQATFENYNLPPGWESNDGGETIERVSGDGKGIVKSSQWGKFLESINQLDDGVDDVLTEESQFRANDWIGCRFRWEVTDLGKGRAYKLKDKDTGETKEGVSKDKNFPVAYLGKDSPVSASSASSNGNGATTSSSLSVLTDLHNPVIESQIQELAKTLPHTDWFKQSYALVQGAGIEAGQVSDLITAMGGRELYESLGGKG